MTKSDPRREQQWLEDINEAIDKIQTHEKFDHGKAAFETDEHYQVWVLYHMERIGECVSRLRLDFDYDQKHPEIDWKGTQGMRRRLVHQYWNIDKDRVWEGVEYLPKIKDKVDRVLEEKERGGIAPNQPPQRNLDRLLGKSDPKMREQAVEREPEDRERS
jgi:uncharacterized protein with HEPN domain